MPDTDLTSRGQLLTLAQAARRCGISERTLRRAMDQGQLAWVNVGAGEQVPRYRITEQQLADWLVSRAS